MIEKEHIHSVMRNIFPRSRVQSFSHSPVARTNHVYKVCLNQPDQKVILRVSSRDEPWKTEKEKRLHHFLSKLDIPVPKFIHADSTRSVIPYRYQVMELLPGHTWKEGIEKVPEAQRKKVYEELGETLARIHSVKWKKFGWVHCDKEKIPSRSESWQEVFMHMCLDELLDLDHPQFSGLTPHIRDYIIQHQHLLDLEAEPRLLHNDFFGGNVLLHEKDGEWRISGVLDLEHAFAGHNEFELAKVVSQLLLDYPSHDYKPEARSFFKGYEKRIPVSQDFGKRRSLYNLYHLMSWTNQCVRSMKRYEDAGDDVNQFLKFFRKDMESILKQPILRS